MSRTEKTVGWAQKYFSFGSPRDRPLTLGLNFCPPQKRRFHFESFWTQLPGFYEAVKQNWEALVFSSCAAERFCSPAP
jgi:hypothetical protein